MDASVDVFHQTYLLERGKLVFWAEMDNHMPEELARRLDFHVDPTRRDVRARDEDGDGVFCDGQNCAICAQKPQSPGQAIEAVLREFEAAAALSKRSGESP